ncbi:glycosyltransferase family 2 protein [Natronomonas sp. EA1]|uniref:glycosyltransferase family 2 protein n=1 Tax=Natronomonas sp. EA1 TaxID=3421655 RepID=UPI003EB94A14
MPKVSVLLTTYNGEKTVREAIESVREQDFEDYELLIGDDSSTDSTPEIIESMARGDPRTNVYLRDENVGIPENMNRLVEEATGEILAFLEQDDYWLDTKLRTHTDRHEQADAAVVYSDFEVENRSGKELGTVYTPDPKPAGKPLVEQLYQHHNFIGAFCNVSMKRSTWEEIGGADTRLRVSADFDLWLRLAGRYAFEHIDSVLATKRVHDRNQSSNHAVKYADNRLILSESLSRYPYLRKKEKKIRSELLYQYANGAFHDGNASQGCYRSLQSLTYAPTFRAVAIAVLSSLDAITGGINLGTRIYEVLSRSDRTQLGWP